MFSPAIKRPGAERNLGNTALHSPITPLTENRRSFLSNSIPDRPSTGTPAPWAPRLSVLARYTILYVSMFVCVRVRVCS
jgi:nuclear pore complex protein Nup133